MTRKESALAHVIAFEIPGPPIGKGRPRAQQVLQPRVRQLHQQGRQACRIRK